MKAVIVRENGDVHLVDEDFNQYDKLNGVVGGYIEHLPWHCGAHAYINEEGKLRGMAYNDNATLLMKNVIAFGDVIVGPMILLGEDGEGGEADIPNAAIAEIQFLLDTPITEALS